MDIKDLKSLIKMVTETDITEFDLENADEKITIKRGHTPEVIHYQAPQQMAPVQYAMPAQMAATAPQAAHATSSPAVMAVTEKGQTITSPIVGTFYRAPSPEAPPYVEIGTEVSPETVVCIVEAMKVMNEIKADARSRILKITAENSRPVTAGQTLFLTEPA